MRTEASEASASGKYKRALQAYLELEKLEPRDAQWSKRAAETYRRLGKDREAISAYARAADRYAQGGFLVQAIAVCKLILQIDPRNDDALRRISAMNEQITSGPTRVATIADNNPTLAENTAVQSLRRQPTGTGGLYGDRKKPTSSPPLNVSRTKTPPNLSRTPTPQPGIDGDVVVAVPRTKSKPVTLVPGSALSSVSLKDEVPLSFEREDNSGVYVIPIDGEEEIDLDSARPSTPVIEIEPTADFELTPAQVDDATELELTDIEEIPLPEPRMLAAAAAEALAATPLFAGMSQEALGSLVEQLQLVTLSAGEVLFYEGDPGDALYVIVEGEVSVSAEGPPRVEMARLQAGSFIGEVALMTDQPRSATVTAVADAELLRIDRKTLSKVLAEHGEVLHAVLRFVRDRLVDRWVRTSPLFRPFDAVERSQLAARFKFLEVADGSVLLGSGERPDGLYIVLAGQFIVRRGKQEVATLGPGELIGETALLSGGQFKSDVVAKGKSLALCLPAADFRDMIMTHPHVLEYIGEAAEHSRKLQIL
ncbi:MAG: cyclic nucleotide-binding domain-containing protein [Deltaproteobacteria bacterium]|nr:cyclic nucleotide-binding domain-containing protein [Deltaproteobacteria bacterium]